MSQHKSDFGLHGNTLRHQLLRWVLIPLVILLVVNIVLAYQLGHDSANRRHDKFLLEASKILLDQLRTNDGRVDFNLHTGALDILNTDPKDQVYFTLKGWKQNFHFGYSDLPLPENELSATPVYYLANYLGQPVRMMAAILPESDVASGRVIVIVGKTLHVHQERTQEWMWRILPSQTLSILLAGIMVWWGVGRGLRPLLHLRDEIVMRSSLDLRPLPENKVVAEVQPLIRSFNGLMGRLDESLVLQRRFVADAAHQLRTPLTGLKAQAELALRLEDTKEIHHSLQQIRKAADHAAHLANQLLALARTEPEVQRQEAMVGLDLAALAKQTTEYWVSRALSKNIDLGYESDAGEHNVTGNVFLLGEMLNNLLDNAIRYVQPGGRVTIRLAHDAAANILEVEDNGPGIPEAERERVFERFYRLLESNQDGCGLGLSIVQEIVKRHDADISVLSGAGGHGTRVRIKFPSKYSA